MTAVVPLPNALHNATQTEIAAEVEQGCAAVFLAGAMSELREATPLVVSDPNHVGKNARALWALARWREAERRWKQAAHICEIRRGALALEAAKTLGVCIECSDTAKDGYCDECREEREAPPY